ncbi:MAG TPA: hypothetical protein VMV81_11945 [Phycisphaerae bacterium]|nr:hypothetical protein [Phycisphaerae bacterium]
MTRAKRILLPAIFISLIVSGASSAGMPPATQPGEDVISVEMRPCKQSRFAREISVLKLVLTGNRSTEPLVVRGTLEVGGESYDLYLPKKNDGYSTKNTGSDDSHFINTSTLISIDANHDGELTDDEGWFSNLPVRIADQMFDVVSIAEDGSRVELRRSKAPLAGAVVGRKCPPFSLQTADGRTLTLDSFAGKAFLLDVWSVT